jgi:hypothetical protein
MEATQKNIRAYRASFQNPQKMFGARLQDWQCLDGIKRLVFHGALPSRARRSLFEQGGFDHDRLPGAFGDLRVAGRQVGAGDLQIDGWLPEGLIARGPKPFGFVFVPCFEAFLLATQIVLDEKNAAAPLEKPVSSFHKHPFRMPGVEGFALGRLN